LVDVVVIRAGQGCQHTMWGGGIHHVVSSSYLNANVVTFCSDSAGKALLTSTLLSANTTTTRLVRHQIRSNANPGAPVPEREMDRGHHRVAGNANIFYLLTFDFFKAGSEQSHFYDLDSVFGACQPERALCAIRNCVAGR
jgi:hypothetical protein